MEIHSMFDNRCFFILFAFCVNVCQVSQSTIVQPEALSIVFKPSRPLEPQKDIKQLKKHYCSTVV